MLQKMFSLLVIRAIIWHVPPSLSKDKLKNWQHENNNILKPLDKIICKCTGMKINSIHHFMSVTKINCITDEELDEWAKSPPSVWSYELFFVKLKLVSIYLFIIHNVQIQ